MTDDMMANEPGVAVGSARDAVRCAVAAIVVQRQRPSLLFFTSCIRVPQDAPSLFCFFFFFFSAVFQT